MNSLKGRLPTELVFSRSIAVFDVSFNCLDGHLQEVQSSNPSLPLQVLNISSNSFTGQFPLTTWEVRKNLVALNASKNSFTGRIPSSICIKTPSLAILDLSYNQFSGNISPRLGSCSMMRILKAGHNNLSGALPKNIFNITSLEHLSLLVHRIQTNKLMAFTEEIWSSLILDLLVSVVIFQTLLVN
jgi:hypothetical protein